MHPLNLTGIPKLIAALFLGFILGFILLQSKLAFRKTLIDQFTFKDNRFAITLLVSMALGIPFFYFLKNYDLVRVGCSNYQVWALVVGAIITGLGVAFCGHIPITAIASFGSGKLYSLWIFLGMLSAFPIVKWIRPIINDYVYGRKAPSNVNELAHSSFSYSTNSSLFYIVPAICLILALFLRLTQPGRR
jgi:uncharacterized protein